jgi:hypothetical protein
MTHRERVLAALGPHRPTAARRGLIDLADWLHCG